MIPEKILIDMLNQVKSTKTKVLIKSKLYANDPFPYPGEQRGYGFLHSMATPSSFCSNELKKLEKKYGVQINYLFYLSDDDFKEERGCYIFLDLALPATQLRLF